MKFWSPAFRWFFLKRGEAVGRRDFERRLKLIFSSCPGLWPGADRRFTRAGRLRFLSFRGLDGGCGRGDDERLRFKLAAVEDAGPLAAPEAYFESALLFGE